MTTKPGITHGGVTKNKVIAVAGKRKRQLQQFGVIDRLSHPGADGVMVVLRFNSGAISS